MGRHQSHPILTGGQKVRPCWGSGCCFSASLRTGHTFSIGFWSGDTAGRLAMIIVVYLRQLKSLWLVLPDVLGHYLAKNGISKKKGITYSSLTSQMVSLL